MKYFHHRGGEEEMIRPGLTWSWDSRWFVVRLFIPFRDREHFFRFGIRLAHANFEGQSRLSSSYNVRQLL